MNNLYQHDIYIAKHGAIRIAGVDEAGRGPLAGPVVAAAVILDMDTPIDKINDSKKITEKRRSILYKQITASQKYGLGIADPKEIDEINILQATFLAMKRAIQNLKDAGGTYDLLLIDGNQYIPDLPRNRQQTITSGDATSASIAAASIVAKVARDKMMEEYHEKYPEYDFAKHKGYGTKHHREMIAKHGLCDIHRETFCRGIL
jgi:ribonuclease HII